MIGLDELKKYKELTNSSLYNAEKEYLQYIFLKYLSSLSNNFIFKGGTCLRICYGFERASEDLDFNTSLSLEKIDFFIKKVLNSFSLLSIDHEITSIKEYKGNIRYELRFQGPLFNGNPRSSNNIKLDFNTRKIYRSPDPKVVPKIFSDISTFSILTLNSEEILAEKLRALQMRVQPRDLYDVWYLLNLDIDLDFDLLKEKLNDDNISFFSLKFPSKKEFDQDMKLLLSKDVDYDFIIKDVESKLNRLTSV